MERNRRAAATRPKSAGRKVRVPSQTSVATQGEKVGAGNRIKSLAMTIRLLTEMAHAGSAIGVTELARRVGESKARIHRHLQTLRDAGILAQSDSNERYRLGWVLFELGQAAAAQFEVADIAASAMRQLRDATHLTVVLGQRDGDEIIVSDTIASENMIAVTARKGLRLPARSSAMGRVMLAFATDEEQARLLRGSPIKGAFPPKFSDDELRDRLRRVRDRRFDHSQGESQVGVNGLAAPILDTHLNVAAIVAVIGTARQIGDNPDPKLVDLVLRCAAAISNSLNARLTTK